MIAKASLTSATLAATLLGISVTSAFAASLKGAAVAQLTLPIAPTSSGANGTVQTGAYVTAPIILDGATLFRIAAPVNAPISQLPIGTRVMQIQATLTQLVAETGAGTRATPVFDAATLRIHDRHIGDALVLEAVDAKHPDPLPIVTVTSADADANAKDLDTLANTWRDALQSGLMHALVLRQPAVERRSFQSILRLAAMLIAVSLLVWGLLRALWRRMAGLENEITRIGATQARNPVEPGDAQVTHQRRRLFALQLRTLKPVQRLSLYAATAETLLWALAIAWLIATTWGLSLFAETTPLSQTIGRSALGVRRRLCWLPW